MNPPGTDMERFKYLSIVAELVLVTLHSNAEQERLFSCVRTDRFSIFYQIGGSLSGIISMKRMYSETNIPCHK